MERIDDILDMIDIILNSKRKRHLVGGALLSASLLFGGLAITVLSIRTEERYEK